MRFAIAYHKKNIAGKNIVEQFKKLGFAPQVPVIELSKETVYSDGFDKVCKELRGVDFLVFASTHKSVKNFPSLCLHAPGNWRGADLGGSDGKVCKTSAFVLKYLFQKLNKNAEQAKASGELSEDYNVTLEVTHHGPLIDLPCCFIEVGSCENEWRDEKAAKVVAKTILSLQDFDKEKCEELGWIPCILMGGQHYNQAANKIMLRTNYAVGHIIPKYALPVTGPMIKEAEEKTLEHVSAVLIDWKGCGKSEDRQNILSVVGESGLEVRRTSNIKKEK